MNVLNYNVLGTSNSNYICKYKNTESVRVVKIHLRSAMTESLEKKFAMEVALLKKIDHPNVVRLYEVFKDERAYYLVKE